jgi:hypothetical protein
VRSEDRGLSEAKPARVARGHGAFRAFAHPTAADVIPGRPKAGPWNPDAGAAPRSGIPDSRFAASAMTKESFRAAENRNAARVRKVNARL